jgi:pyridinium-3,5-bisthiocarboxylic acid mononucleotide nickel chelatase
MRVVYFDCFAGASGDMILGALVDLGIDLESLKRQLSSLGLGGYEIKTERVKRSGIAATKFHVEVDEGRQPARKFADIRDLIMRADLSEQVKSRSVCAFLLLAEAEARVHESTMDEVHFHEVGAVDSIIDTVGAMIGFELLGAKSFFCSPVRLGHGAVKTAHGLLPVPAPATAELLAGVPVYAGEIEGEFVTPTGAAIVTSLCEGFGPMPEMKISRVGYGAGSRDPKGFPNALRLVTGETVDEDVQTDAPENVMVVETNIDDMNPQAYETVLDRAFARGALDAFLTPVQMKKTRPGVLLTVLCERECLEAIIGLLLSETTTLGVRYYEAKRRVLDREIESVETEYGSVRLKVARDGARTLHFQPEYEDCARISADRNVPVIEVQSAASAAYRVRLRLKEDADETGDKKE